VASGALLEESLAALGGGLGETGVEVVDESGGGGFGGGGSRVIGWRGCDAVAGGKE
jgi:hypothetical protein